MQGDEAIRGRWETHESGSHHVGNLSEIYTGWLQSPQAHLPPLFSIDVLWRGEGVLELREFDLFKNNCFPKIILHNQDRVVSAQLLNVPCIALKKLSTCDFHFYFPNTQLLNKQNNKDKAATFQILKPDFKSLMWSCVHMGPSGLGFEI